MIDIVVSKTIYGRIEEVFRKLLDVSSYSQWWSLPVTNIEPQIHLIKINPIKFVGISLLRTDYSENKFIDFEYVGGPFRGKGRWSFKVLSSNDTIEISYHIQLTPQNRLIGMIAKTDLFKQKHTNDIIRIINAL